MALVSYAEVGKHNRREDCWVIIHGKVYNMTSFLDSHPGGVAPILSKAGKDATASFDVIHPKDMVNSLPSGCYVGDVDPSTVIVEEKEKQKEEKHPSQQQEEGIPPMDHLLNVFDFEAVARKVLKKEAWDYYSSGADDEVTLRENHSAFQRIWLRPRVLLNVSVVDPTCKILGYHSNLPIYITATALGKLAHPEGEVVITRAAYNQGLIQMLPTLASCSLDEMTAARQPGQIQFFQLYVNSNRKATEEMVKKAERNGCKALFITVDAPQLGRREKDMRNKFTSKESNVLKGQSLQRNQGTAKAISSFIDPSLCWADLDWFKSITSLPIILKGIQCAEDALLAAQHGVAGIVLSNHGGRQLDYSRSGIEVLPEVMEALRSVGAEKKMEVFVDGGVRRGTDIFKALALGATAVGVGRPVLYGLASYGQQGVERVLEMLKEEFQMAMMLMGTVTLKDIKPSMCNIRNLADHLVLAPQDFLATHTYEQLVPRSKL